MYLMEVIDGEMETVGEWRKTNHVHNWFVNNAQGGIDDCSAYPVSYKQLAELKKICEDVLTTKDSTKLPRAEGFFFGSAEIDEWYFEDLKRTVAIISELPPKNTYFYRASW